jgi:hypothetical protein
MLVSRIETGRSPLPSPDERAAHVAAFVTATLRTGWFPESGQLPDDPGYNFLIDDPTGHFPLEPIHTSQLRFSVSTQLARLYAIGSEASTTSHEATLRTLKREQDPLRLERIAKRFLPQPRQFAFKSLALTDNLALIRPVTELPSLLEKYGKL